MKVGNISRYLVTLTDLISYKIIMFVVTRWAFQTLTFSMFQLVYCEIIMPVSVRVSFQSKLLQLWKNVQDEDPNKSMLDWLSVFYNSLLSTWHSELMWCSQVFGNPDAVLCLLLTQTFSHLDPPFSVCLRDYVQNHKYPLQELIDLKQVSGSCQGKYFTCL